MPLNNIYLSRVLAKELEGLSSIKQPSIARVEKMHSDPHLHTLIKLLLPLGKTLAIMPLEQANS